MTADELNKRESELAAKVMALSIGKLLLKQHFFSAAVGRLQLRQIKGTMLTDGRALGYDPAYILRRYKADDALPVHDCLHALMHNIFRHWNVGYVRQPLWDAACDIAAEALIGDISPDTANDGRAEERMKIIQDFALEVKPLTAEKLYAYMDRNDFSDEQAAEYSALFSVDDHRPWHRNRLDPEKEPESELPHFFPEFDGEGEKSDRDMKSGGGQDDSRDSGDDANITEVPQGGGDSANDIEKWLDEKHNADKSELAEQWKEIAKQIQSELESFGRGSDTQRLIDVLERVDCEKTDYSAFLRRFAVSGELMRPDMDAFDIGYYCYGLDLYGDVALIEPPEHREVRRIKDFVIAIDTSGSVSGKAVHDFVQKTYTILKSEESFFSRVNIHILQCDTRIEDCAVINSEEDIERYIDDLEIKGLGGTDFRPVFEYVDGQLAEGRLSGLKGLIYFTDGVGAFPEKAPDYETAFIFLEGDYERNDRPAVPPWAIKLVLEEGDVLDGI